MAVINLNLWLVAVADYFDPREGGIVARQRCALPLALIDKGCKAQLPRIVCVCVCVRACAFVCLCVCAMLIVNTNAVAGFRGQVPGVWGVGRQLFHQKSHMFCSIVMK